MQLAGGAQAAIRFTKQTLNHWYRANAGIFDASLAYEMIGFGGPDAREGLTSHQEKRAPSSPVRRASSRRRPGALADHRRPDRGPRTGVTSDGRGRARTCRSAVAALGTVPAMAAPRLCEGRICIVTGGARGIGRQHALMLAEHGAKVVVNDFGGARDGTGGDPGPANEVVAEITAAGGEAVANSADVSDFAAAGALVQQAIDTYGGLDVVVSNAGILRDRMLFSMTEEEWDAVIRVHLKGTFAPARHAAGYWRDRAKAGETNDARLITTTSVSGLYGNMGQTNYGAAKAGIAAMTLIAADELARYGVTANSIAPGALTRMTEDLGIPDENREAHGPALDRPDRDVAGVDGVRRRHRPGHRVDRHGDGDRRGLAPRPGDRQAAGRPGATSPASSSRCSPSAYGRSAMNGSARREK